MGNSKNIIDVDHVSIRFNLANEKVNDLKASSTLVTQYVKRSPKKAAIKIVNFLLTPAFFNAL